MTRCFEGQFKADDGAEIFYQGWTLQQSVGTLVVTHGIAEHSDCYQNFAHNLNSQGWEVLAWDLRGHGRSEGKRGYVSHFSEFSRDLNQFIELIRKDFHTAKKPLVLFGHSLGGLVVVQYLLNYSQEGFAAACLSSPALGLRIEVPRLKKAMAEWSSRWLPELTLWNELNYENLTRDQELVKSYSADPLRHDRISPRLFLGMLENFKTALEKANDIRLPLLLQIAGQDRVTSPAVCEEFFRRVRSDRKILHIYEDSYHEIFNDINRSEVFEDLYDFLKTV